MWRQKYYEIVGERKRKMEVVINVWKHHGYLRQRTTEDKYNRIALLFTVVLDVKLPQRTQLSESHLLGIGCIFPGCACVCLYTVCSSMFLSPSQLSCQQEVSREFSSLSLICPCCLVFKESQMEGSNPVTYASVVVYLMVCIFISLSPAPSVGTVV